MDQIVDISSYTPEDYTRAHDTLWPEDSDSEPQIHPWLDELLSSHAAELVFRIETERLREGTLVDFIREQLLIVMTVGIAMGEQGASEEE